MRALTWPPLPDSSGACRPQLGNPFLIAASCFWPTSVTPSGGTGSSGAPSNSSVTNALPSVNSNTVTDLDPSGDIDRLWALVAEAITRCDQATVYDNSGLKGPRDVAQMSEGFIVGSPAWPDWTPHELQSRWPTR
ncbi:MAG: hypothetical protein JWQ31_2186 [Mycobacterium sp.]|nr:hypothetical protein [Mycobacterium sp.]